MWSSAGDDDVTHTPCRMLCTAPDKSRVAQAPINHTRCARTHAHKWSTYTMPRARTCARALTHARTRTHAHAHAHTGAHTRTHTHRSATRARSGGLKAGDFEDVGGAFRVKGHALRIGGLGGAALVALCAPAPHTHAHDWTKCMTGTHGAHAHKAHELVHTRMLPRAHAHTCTHTRTPHARGHASSPTDLDRPFS